MGLGDKQAEKLKALAQEHVGEPVESAAIFLRKGETASRNIGAFAPGVSLGKWADSMKRAPDFPAQTLIAVDGGWGGTFSICVTGRFPIAGKV